MPPNTRQTHSAEIDERGYRDDSQTVLCARFRLPGLDVGPGRLSLRHNRRDACARVGEDGADLIQLAGVGRALAPGAAQEPDQRADLGPQGANRRATLIGSTVVTVATPTPATAPPRRAVPAAAARIGAGLGVPTTMSAMRRVPWPAWATGAGAVEGVP